MARGVCERCGNQRHVGKFRDNAGKRYQKLCGGCKIKLTLTPERKAKLEQELRAALLKGIN